MIKLDLCISVGFKHHSYKRITLSLLVPVMLLCASHCPLRHGSDWLDQYCYKSFGEEGAGVPQNPDRQ